MNGNIIRQLFLTGAVLSALLPTSCVSEQQPEGSGVTTGIEILFAEDYCETRSAVGPESALDGYDNALKDMTVFYYALVWTQ